MSTFCTTGFGSGPDSVFADFGKWLKLLHHFGWRYLWAGISFLLPAAKKAAHKGELDMKKTIVRMILAILFLVASGSTPILADGPGPAPLCYPGEPCR